jgi:hypothetical protein
MSVVMYPDLKNRREFVHDCWIIASSCENDELKVAISNDKFFYLTRKDLLVLLLTHDNKIITHVLKRNCKLYLDDDISYKLIAIKEQQVDNKQHSPVMLTDFLSVMVMSKREEQFKHDSKI